MIDTRQYFLNFYNIRFWCPILNACFLIRNFWNQRGIKNFRPSRMTFIISHSRKTRFSTQKSSKFQIFRSVLQGLLCFVVLCNHCLSLKWYTLMIFFWNLWEEFFYFLFFNASFSLNTDSKMTEWEGKSKKGLAHTWTLKYILPPFFGIFTVGH